MPDAGQPSDEEGPEAQLATDIRALADRTASPMVFLDRRHRIRYSNPAAGWLVGRTPESLEGIDVLTLVHPSEREAVRQDLADVISGCDTGEPAEYRVRAADGSWKTLSAVASNLLDLSSSGGILISATDVTEQRAQEHTLREMALRDATTGLPNRRALREHLDHLTATDRNFSVAFIDIDDFRRINDCLGHTVGDTVLQSVAERITAMVPARNLVAHFGGDTFVVALEGVKADRAVRLAWELIARISSPLYVAGHELCLSSSVGVAVRDDASTTESMLRDADAALARAKGERRGGVQVFTEGMRIEAVDRLAMETDLRRAIDHGELRVHFQPVVRLSDGHIGGAEALLRWWRPNGEPVDPSSLIQVGEDTGLINSITDWVLVRSLAALTSGAVPSVSVNLSPRELLDPGLPVRFERLLAVGDIPPAKVAFEVTEAVIIDNFQLARDSLNRLRRLGCSVGLDDFGTGYSSLGYLRRLQVDFLKLDRELVDEIDTDHQARHIAETIVSLARTLGLATVAEGVERQTQADALQVMGCDFGQGWLFGRPKPV